MATLSEDTHSWKAGSIINRDARNTHNGPEVPRYRKKAKRRKTCKGGNPHEFTKFLKHYRGWSDAFDGWDVMACAVCGKQKWVTKAA